MTGRGVDAFLEAVEEKRGEFERDYGPELERRRAEAERVKAEVREREVGRMMRDMRVSSKVKGTGKYAPKEEPETVSEAEEMDEDDEGGMVEEGELDGMVDPDEEDEDEEDVKETFDDGLKARYQQALKDSSGASGLSKAADHIMRSQR
jgi:hypothetical protein